MREPNLTVRLAGAIGLQCEDRQATERDLPGRQPRLAFAVLVWDRGHTVTHEQLAEIVWSAGPPSTWQPALRGIVSKVRGVFDLVGLDADNVLSGEAGSYKLNLPEATIVDLEQAITQVSEAERVLADGGVETARRLSSEARTVLSRPILAGIDSPWLDQRRNEMTAAHVRCLEVLGECRRNAGEYDSAAHVVEALLAVDPFRESAWRLLMLINVGAGNAAQALLVYQRCRMMLADELGADPSPETQELHADILRGTPRPERAEPAVEETPALVAADRGSRISGPPYRGLEPFGEEHASLFFGRDAAVAALVERLNVHRFVAVVGASGTGKSSLVRAGLLPALRSGALPDADTWRRVVVLPGQNPIKSLGSELLESRPRQDTQAAIDRLSGDPAALHDAASAILAGRPIAEQLLVVIDQFEEVFSLCRDDDLRRSFVAAILDATRRRDSRTVVVLTMRADFYHHAARLPDLAAALSTSQFVVAPLDGDGLEQAIERPAELAGLKFEDGLVGRILTDVAGEPGALPLLQHALLELYDRRADHVLTRGAYEDIGGVSGALSRRAETVWSSFTPDEQKVAKGVLLRLTEPGQGTDDTRRRAAFDELVGETEQAVSVETVIGELADARLLTTSSDPATGTRYTEVAHEALIRGWPRLARWIDDDRAGLRIHRRLTEASLEWARGDRHPDYLLVGIRLGEATEWAAGKDPDLNPLEREFFEASIESDRVARRRRKRLRRLVTTGLAAGLVVVGLLALAAVAQRNRAGRQSDLAGSREVAAEAANQLAIDPELSVLLAIEAYEIAPTVQAEAALRQAVVGSHVRRRLPTEGSDPVVEISLNGKFVATAPNNGAVSVFDAATGERLHELTDGEGNPPTATINSIAFSPDSSHLAASNSHGRAWIWRVADGHLVKTLEWPEGPKLLAIAQDGLSWDPLGSRVVVAAFDGTARIFDTETGKQVHALTAGPPRDTVFARARFSPDGRRVAVVGADGAAALFDAATGKEVARLAGHSRLVNSLKFSADGSTLVTASEDRSARTWDANTGKSLKVFVHDTPVRDAAVNHDGTKILTGDLAGVVRLWDSANDHRIELTGHDTRISQVRFSPQGDLALSASFDGTTRLWDSKTGNALGVFKGAAQPAIDIEFTPDGRFIVTAGDDVRIWEVPQGAVSILHAHDAPIWDIAFSPDGRLLATGGAQDGVARLWDLEGGTPRAEFRESKGAPFVNVDISRNGLMVTSPGVYIGGQASDTGPARVWDTARGELVSSLPRSEDDPLDLCGASCPLTDAVFSPDGQMVAVTGWDGRAHVFEPISGREAHNLGTGAHAPLVFLDWSPDGLRVVALPSGPFGSSPIAWEVSSGKRVLEIPEDTYLVVGRVRFSPNGQLVIGAVGASARIWDAGTGRLVGELRHRGTVRDVVFSPDGKLVITGSADGAAIWDLASQRLLTELPGHHGEVYTVALSPDGSRIATGGNDGTVRFFECQVCQPANELLTLARKRVTRELSATERARFLHKK